MNKNADQVFFINFVKFGDTKYYILKFVIFLQEIKNPVVSYLLQKRSFEIYCHTIYERNVHIETNF